MNHKTYPRGYRQIDVIDFARNRRQMWIVALSSLAVKAIMVIGMLPIRPIGPCWEFVRGHLWTLPLLLLALGAYVVLHELTHGLLMWAMSGVKPNYGVSLMYAWAGSRVYFDKRSHVLIALAPLIVWGGALIALGELLPPEWFWLVWLVQISNVSGAVGDVYCSLYVARLPKEIVVQDTGTRMRILAPIPQKPSQGKPI